jgi:dynein heavy chain
LSVFIATYETYQIEVTKNYDFKAWREDMRDRLFGEAGTLEKSMIFLLSDTQIVTESFLEDINNILNNGEIPNLYSTNEEISNIIDTMQE